MKVIAGTANSWVQCIRPNGCGWYWQRRTVKAHWWSRVGYQYRGAFWEDSEGRANLSSRPDDGGKTCWFSQAEFEDWYGDCLKNLQQVQALEAIAGSRQ